jgi:alkylation response protein AidB-like acyl-CoA dehydrogenase
VAPKVERIYREVKVNAIGGGTEEIMKDLASRQMGLSNLSNTAARASITATAW